MQAFEEATSEDLVRAMRQAHLNDDQSMFTTLAGVLLQRYQTYIAMKVARKLRPAELMQLAKDAAADIERRILADVRAPQAKRGMDTAFISYLNETCRDTLETFLRQEGVPVPTRHKARSDAPPRRPDRVPQDARVSLDAPVANDDDPTLGETVPDEQQQSPETVVMDRIERIERLQTLTPDQRMMVVVYGDFVDRQLKADQIAARRSISSAEVKRYYNEACSILQKAKEHRDV